MTVKEINEKTMGGTMLHTLKAMLAKVEVNITSTNKKYLNLIFRDKTGEMNVKQWDADEKTKANYKINGVYLLENIEGKPFNGNPSYVLKSGSKIKLLEDELPSDYCNDFTPPVEELMATIHYYMDQLKGEYREVVKAAFKTLEDYNDFFIWPAAESMHHHKACGLAYHTATMLKIADAIVAVTPDANRQLLLTATLLHDFFKTSEYGLNEDGGAYLTAQALRGGHIVLGADFISDCVRNGVVSENTGLLLEHMLLSHHGEYGPELPAFMEAMILHYVDMIDSRSYMFREAYAEMEHGEYSKKKHFGIGTRIYRP